MGDEAGSGDALVGVAILGEMVDRQGMDDVSAAGEGGSRIAWAVLAGLCGLTLLLGLIHGAYIPFWADELATFHIAEASTWGEMFRLTRTVDLNPPLEAGLVWLSVHALGANQFAGRLPSVLGYTVTVGCMFVYLRRRMPLWFATAGALLLLYNESLAYYATEARPYAVLMGTLGVALLFYDGLIEGRGEDGMGERGLARGLARVGLALAILSVLMSHVFGLFAVGAFLLAETVRTARRRRVDVATWAALLVPMASCILYAPLLRGQHGLSYPAEYRPGLLSGVHVYTEFLLEPVVRFVAVAVVALLFFRVYPAVGFRRFVRLRAESWALMLVLLGMPLILGVMMRLRSPEGGFFPRYTVAVVYAAIFFPMAFLAWRSRENLNFGRGLAVLALGLTLVNDRGIAGEARVVMHRGLFAGADQVASTGGVGAIEPDLPLVENNALAFLQADNRLPVKDTARLVYVTSEAESLRIAHSDAGESLAGMAAAFHLHGRVVPYADFMAREKRFLVIGEADHVGDWFLQDVLNQGGQARFLGRYEFAGKHQMLWLVTMEGDARP